MRLFSPFTILISAFMVAGCAGSGQEEREDINPSPLVPNAKADQAELPYWDDPNIDHIATEWPVDDDDLKIWDVPDLKSPFIDTTPEARNDGLVFGELGVDSGNRELIVKLAREIAEGQHGKIGSLLIVHRGKLLFESYYLNGRINLTQPQASATKTYTGLALGRAMQLGYLTMADLDKPLVSFLDDLDPTTFVEGSDRITLHHALTNRTGIRVSEEQTEEFRNNPDRIQGQALIQAVLERTEPITTESLSTFSYGGYSTDLVMQVIDAVVPGTAEEFIRNELLGKMGITTYRWLPGMSGLPAGGWKSSMTARAMAKIGGLAMNKGKWNGEQLIPEAFISKATSRILYTGDEDIFGGGKDVSNQGYGYLWWSGDLKSGDRRYFSTSAQGGGGQFIILIDELDLVVVATGHERHPVTIQMVAERILPAFTEVAKNQKHAGKN